MTQETEHNGVVAVEAAETSKDARQLLADITAGLEGVTPGPWGSNSAFVVGPRSDADDQSYGMIIGIADVYGENRRQDAAHIARCYPSTMQAIADLVANITPRKNLYKGKYRAVLKLLNRTRNKLVGITDHIEDDGDRRYFGSTNDADDLIELFHNMESWIWDALDKHNQMKSDPYADIREQRARADKAEALIAELEAERQWQPIETAPKDGTVILGKGGIYHGFPFPVKWAPSQYRPDRSWESVINGSNFYDHCITHWMHLPASPHEGTQS